MQVRKLDKPLKEIWHLRGVSRSIVSLETILLIWSALTECGAKEWVGRGLDWVKRFVFQRQTNGQSF